MVNTSRYSIVALLMVLLGGPALAGEPFHVLVFSKTAGFRHDSIGAGVALVEALGEENGFGVDATEEASTFTDEGLAPYRGVIWLNTTGDVLDRAQEAAFERYIRSGGGYVGVHSAADTEHDWPFYGELLGGGAWFLSHPAIQTAQLDLEEPDHPSTVHLAFGFAFTDEWYSFRGNPRGAVNVLLTIDESTYDPGPHPMGDHPIAWFHELDGGRAWYTNLGHRSETYAEFAFGRHLLGGVLWAAAVVETPVCGGDCDMDGVVDISELVTGVAIALGTQPIDRCFALDADRSRGVTVDEIGQAVSNTLEGCRPGE